MKSGTDSNTERALAVRYGYDRKLHEKVNAEGHNYWYAYVEEILSRIGVSASPLDLEACGDAGELAGTRVLILGNFESRDLPSGLSEPLLDWVSGGGVLIGFATEGLDDLIGVATDGSIPQEEGPFSINGYFELGDSPVTEGCRADIDPEQRLIAMSPIRLLRCGEAEELARLFTCDPENRDDGSLARSSEYAAITHMQLGSGHAFLFAFDLAQTMWAIQQGKPVLGDYDGDGWLRRTDATVVGDNSRGVPYTDALHFLLSSMIGRAPVPIVHQIPPRDGRVAPALLYFGGDDECSPGNQVPASDFMAERGLPYHMNIMLRDGKFAMGPEEQAHIEANGHEIAVHYNFVDGFDHPCGFTREDVLSQAARFKEVFGKDSVCGVNHCVMWCGWAEPARWMLEAGNKADNSFFGWTSPPKNPVNTLGFVHGSAFPRYFWDDAEHGNARIDFLEIPITGYELGYLEEECFPERMREALELAVQFHLTFNFFFHPGYVAKYPACQKAIDELVRLMGDMEVPPVLMGPDAVFDWWESKSRATIENAHQTPTGVAFDVACDYADGFVVKLPTGDLAASECTVDGATTEIEDAVEFGQHWAYVVLEEGEHQVEVKTRSIED
ncbi:MAG: hypothetical protein QGI83_14455 [Candidatus Latescibacteria bacterium]|jgi:hypothetical protein|nr:hypothetical protein [Candidatus Latescibacterota bacterium]